MSDIEDVRRRWQWVAEWKPRTWIYVIQMGGANGPVKIGFSRNPHARLLDLSVGNPMQLELLATIAGDKSDEALLHRRFRKYRLKGEWFEFRGEVAAWVGEPAPPIDPVSAALNEYLLKIQDKERFT